MNPWTPIGWFFLIFIGVFLARFLIETLGLTLIRRWRHYRTRNTLVAIGQRWWCGTHIGEVKNIYKSHFSFEIKTCSSRITLPFSTAEWNRYVRTRKAFLLS